MKTKKELYDELDRNIRQARAYSQKAKGWKPMVEMYQDKARTLCWVLDEDLVVYARDLFIREGL